MKAQLWKNKRKTTKIRQYISEMSKHCIEMYTITEYLFIIVAVHDCLCFSDSGSDAVGPRVMQAHGQYCPLSTSKSANNE